MDDIFQCGNKTSLNDQLRIIKEQSTVIIMMYSVYLLATGT